jgi:pimeloyl-ACP methyl ester carboxylesterase
MPSVSLPTGVDLYYEEDGSGEPLLLIMGTAADHRPWAAQVEAFRDHYRVITYDARGTGRSTHPADPESYSMRALADDAAALLEHLRVDAAHVSGLSLGSATAQELAVAHPERVRTLQLHCTWGRADEWFRRMIDSMEFMVRHDDPAAYIRCALLWVASPHFLNERTDEVEAFERDFILDNPHPPSKEGMLGHFHADKTHDTLDRLGTIAVPTLITSGEMDWQVPTRYGLEVQRRIPGSTLHVFRGPSSSHIAFHEMADAWNEFTLAWLRRHG